MSEMFFFIFTHEILSVHTPAIDKAGSGKQLVFFTEKIVAHFHFFAGFRASQTILDTYPQH